MGLLDDLTLLSRHRAILGHRHGPPIGALRRASREAHEGVTFSVTIALAVVP